MITISILALRNSVLSSIVDSRQVFSKVNEFLRLSERPPLFTIQLVGLTQEVRVDDDIFSIRADKILDEVEKTDLIIIPALSGDMISATYLNKDYVRWISQQYKNGSEVASLCAGAFLLAFSGLLKGKQCTTHWLYADEFRKFYPAVKLVQEKIITDQNGLYSSGGCNSYWNLLMHLVEKYTNREMAIRTAKYFVIDLDKNIQSPFITFNGLKDHADETTREIQEYIEENYRTKITIEQISETFSISRRTFERRFKKATRKTVIEYIQCVKIEAAKKQLEVGRKTIDEIMSDVGYLDAKTFRDVFKRVTGMTPVNYRNKYNKDITH